MSLNQLEQATVDDVRIAHAAGETISDALAKRIAKAYQWGWASVWFADTGNFRFPLAFNGVEDSDTDGFVSGMDTALFGWWIAGGVHIEPAEQTLRDAMLAYLADRMATDGGGDVDGWADL